MRYLLYLPGTLCLLFLLSMFVLEYLVWSPPYRNTTAWNAVGGFLAVFGVMLLLFGHYLRRQPDCASLTCLGDKNRSACSAGPTRIPGNRWPNIPRLSTVYR